MRPRRVLLAVTGVRGRSPLPSFLGLGTVGLSVLLPQKKNTPSQMYLSPLSSWLIFHVSDSSVPGFFGLLRMKGLVGSWNAVSLVIAPQPQVPLEGPHFNNMEHYRNAWICKITFSKNSSGGLPWGKWTSKGQNWHIFFILLFWGIFVSGTWMLELIDWT